ncbi:MAG: hypothetical protein K5683_00650 [Prevotella sp.]|nr:hypothetical protein [Prevotella sp.]
MKHILFCFIFIQLPLFMNHAGAQTLPLDSLCEQIGECLDDVNRQE